MDLIPISDNVMINVDLIESIEMRETKKGKTFIITSGGKPYTVEIDQKRLLNLLVHGLKGKNKNQFFAG